MHSIQAILNQRILVENEPWIMTDGRILERDYIPIYIDQAYKGHLWLYKDVTAREKLNKEVRENDEKYQRMMENMELGMLEVDIHENIVNVYDGFCKMTGYTREELLGENARDLLLFEPEKESFNNEAKKRLSGQSSVYEIQIKKKDGKPIWVLISGTPVFDSRGEIAGSVGIHYDITYQKMLQQELITAKQYAEQAMNAEKSFLANMSHEIRNPLNVVVGMANLLYDTELTKQQKDYTDTIIYSGELLLDLVSDVLDINKINSGEMNPELRPTDINSELAAIVKTFQFRAGNKNLKIEFVSSGNFHWSLLTDRTFLNQIMMNLIGNAIKFTDSGFIKTTLTTLNENENSMTIRIDVEDTGIGIPEDKLSDIFEALKQVNNEVKLKYGGTGLGLSITKYLVEKLGGTIQVSSKLNEGTTFSIFLSLIKSAPLLSVINHSSKSNNKSNFRGKILVAEDFVLNQQYISGLLNKNGIPHTICNNGMEALTALENEHYDLVLLDIRMPVMDGYEATIRIRELQNKNAKIPILALTASALLDEREKALNVGMNEHLTKPFTEEQLLQMISKFLEYLDTKKQEPPAPSGLIDQFPDIFDKEALYTYYGENETFLKSIVIKFCEQMTEDISNLKTLHNSKQIPDLISIIHMIKPNFSLVGLPFIYNRLNDFEDLMSSPEFKSDANFEINFSDLISEIERLMLLLYNHTAKDQLQNS